MWPGLPGSWKVQPEMERRALGHSNPGLSEEEEVSVAGVGLGSVPGAEPASRPSDRVRLSEYRPGAPEAGVTRTRYVPDAGNDG